MLRDRTRRSSPSETKTGLCPLIVNREADSDGAWSQRRKVPESPTLRMLAQKPGSIGRILRYNDGHNSMIPGRIGCELAVVTVLCVLMIFFFPLLQGPYSVVNGPATVFQAARAAARLRIVIMQGALNSLGSLLISPIVILSWMLLSQAESRSVSLPEYNAILRC